jgi:hypothetical protein
MPFIYDRFVENAAFAASGLYISSFVGTSVGYVLGSISKNDPILSAKVGFVASIAISLGVVSSAHLSKDHDSLFRPLLVFQNIVGGLAFTCALRNLQLISTIGTTVLAGTFAASSFVILTK